MVIFESLKMNNSTSTVPALFGDVEIARLEPGDPTIGYSPIEYRVSYINNLPIPLVVEWRSGFKFTLPAQPCMTSNRLIVRVEIYIHHSVKVDIQRILSMVDENSSPELKVMREAFVHQVQNNRYGGARLVLDYPLTLQQLQDYGGTVYYSELDCLFSLCSFDEAPPHPYGVHGRQQSLIEVSASEVLGCGFGYSVDVVDTCGKYGDRYINIGGKIYRIPAVKDPTRRDGIYVVSNAPVQGEYGVMTPLVNHYPFEGAETTLGLYRTAEEAEQLGDASAARKKELAQLEHQLILQRTELQSAKNEHELQMVEMDREVKRLQRESAESQAELERVRQKEELERQRIKDYYEDRAFSRKDNNEALKIIPSIVVGIGAVFMAIKSIFF